MSNERGRLSTEGREKVLDCLYQSWYGTRLTESIELVSIDADLKIQHWESDVLEISVTFNNRLENEPKELKNESETHQKFVESINNILQNNFPEPPEIEFYKASGGGNPQYIAEFKMRDLSGRVAR
jgi:hypothetical protein